MSKIHLYQSKSLLVILTIISLGVLLFTPTIPQPISYHSFADSRNLFDIPNFFNVTSNLFFILVGCIGLYKIFLSDQTIYFAQQAQQWPYVILFTGAILVGIGSSYYHLDPNNITLVWNRVPMDIIAMSYLSAMLMERISMKLGLTLLPILILIGVSCAIYWEITELAGDGDLRLYAWSQFYPISMILLLLIFYPSFYTGTYYLYESFAWYAIAKIGELLDKPIYALTMHCLSGHTIKHITAAIGIYSIIRYLKYRKKQYL